MQIDTVHVHTSNNNHTRMQHATPPTATTATASPHHHLQQSRQLAVSVRHMCPPLALRQRIDHIAELQQSLVDADAFRKPVPCSRRQRVEGVEGVEVFWMMDGGYTFKCVAVPVEGS